eukprot:gene5917-4232_t
MRLVVSSRKQPPPMIEGQIPLPAVTLPMTRRRKENPGRNGPGGKTHLIKLFVISFPPSFSNIFPLRFIYFRLPFRFSRFHLKPDCCCLPSSLSHCQLFIIWFNPFSAHFIEMNPNRR